MIDCKNLETVTPQEKHYIAENLISYVDYSISEEMLNKYFLNVKRNYCKNCKQGE